VPAAKNDKNNKKRKKVHFVELAQGQICRKKLRNKALFVCAFCKQGRIYKIKRVIMCESFLSKINHPIFMPVK
jgi:hypothetical protein